ncbi:hypothetical protein J2X11_000593 [Aeromicrobium panaciterrae]|uniref:Replication initiation factor n=1 Tax=Aeromicrobium panaciterrae TaxID=363861 RepID=A0ABU1UKQ4_9ACTN|nr:hypothetical protein [Aeromicrobium panaciterrae]MDR7085754.1 hypothetical protein [Aeromicrobium panaciterrae]
MDIERNNSLKELASGVDALYLTGRGVLTSALVEDLERARTLASVNRDPVPLTLGNEQFLVGWGPLNKHRFRLEHRHAMVGMTYSDNLPTVFVQPHAEFIHAVGIEAVVKWCRETFAAILGHIDWQVSRMDLFVDVQGWSLVAEDRRDFVSRAKARRTWEDDEDLTGLGWGAGNAILARIYDKTLESLQKGTDWWPSVWGDAYKPGDRVVRVEFQLRRDALRDFGLSDPDDVLRNRRTLWKYLTGEWLSLREPSGDSNRSRRPVSDDWRRIQDAQLAGAPIGDELVRIGSREGSLRILLPALIGYATAAGAHFDARTIEELLVVLKSVMTKDEHVRGVSIEHRLAIQRRRLGLA